jgi:tetratricopeptide (TPR) repeat protein
MKYIPRETGKAPSAPRCWRRFGGIAMILLSLVPVLSGRAQSPPPTSAARSSGATQEPVEKSELTTRAKAAAAAREGGNPADIALANGRLLATALREMAALRSNESAYPQAIALYRSSLTFEDTPITRIGLAIAESKSGHYDEAIALAKQVLASDPQDLRADRILSSSLAQKGDFSAAVEPFTRITNAEPTTENTYALANCLLQTRTSENRARAEDLFRRMEKQDGDSGSLHVLMGRSYRDAGDLPAAIREFQRAIVIDPKTPHAHYFLGLAQLALNEWKPTPEAEAEMRKEVAYYPHDYLANYMAGFLAAGERRYAEAEPYLKAAAEINPSAPEPALYLGLDAYAQSDMKQAESYLRKAVELTGSDEERSNYQIRRAYVDLGRILASSGRQQESEVYLAKARDLQNKVMQQTQQSVASMTAAAGGGASAAVVPLNKEQETTSNDSSGKLDPSADFLGNVDESQWSPAQRAEVEKQEKLLRAVLGLAFNDLATAEAVQGNFKLALDHYKQAEQWDNTLAGLQKNLGQSAFRASDFSEAARALDKALHEQPENTALRAMLGVSYFNLDQYAKAVEAFTPLGEKGMQDEQVGYAWAASLTHLGDMTRASDVLAKYASQPHPDTVVLLIGQLWTAIGDYPQAIKTLQGALEGEPSLPQAHFLSGLAYIRWEHWADAAKEFQAELAITPDDPDAKYHLGFVYLQEAKVDDALATFQQVVAEQPNYANAQYELGKILLDRGQADAAVGHLEAAVRLEPQADFTHYQLQAAYRKVNRVEDADKELTIYKRLKAESRDRAAEAVTGVR